jgi:hypothetical protein
MTVLGGVITAPLGWKVGDSQMVRLPHQGMVWGLVLGAVGGFFLGAAQFFSDMLKLRADANATATPSVSQPTIEELWAQIEKLSEEQRESIRRLAQAGRIREAVQAAEMILGAKEKR